LKWENSNLIHIQINDNLVIFTHKIDTLLIHIHIDDNLVIFTHIIDTLSLTVFLKICEKGKNDLYIGTKIVWVNLYSLRI